MYLFYADDSAGGHFYTFSAIGIPEASWRPVFDRIATFRRQIKESDGIYIRKELHAWKFLSGRGRPSDRFLSQERRLEIYSEAFRLLASQVEQGVILFNVALAGRQDWAFERLLNRINRTMWTFKDLALLICDEGKESEYTKLVRKMGVYNPIPSQYGAWSPGRAAKNIPIDKIIEDPLFKASHRSTLIQLADFCAYGLLRKLKPTNASRKRRMDEVFAILEPICFKAASATDPFGIIK